MFQQKEVIKIVEVTRMPEAIQMVLSFQIVMLMAQEAPTKEVTLALIKNKTVVLTVVPTGALTEVLTVELMEVLTEALTVVLMAALMEVKTAEKLFQMVELTAKTAALTEK